MKPLLLQAVAYGLVSAVALAIDFTVLYLLVDALGFHYLLAATFSFVTGATVAYVLCTRLVFRFRRIADRRLEFIIFAGIGAIGLVINTGAMFVFVSIYGVQYLVAKGAAASLTFGTNFLVRRWALFSPSASSPIPNQQMRKEMM